jgi:hypothetical protein
MNPLMPLKFVLPAETLPTFIAFVSPLLVVQIGTSVWLSTIV